MYSKELEALKRANRYRRVELFNSFIDLASNDYLNLASNRKNFKKACNLVMSYDIFAPRASLLINGYHPIHNQFEKEVAFVNGFEEGLVVGSGFLANIALIEALVRREDELFIDKKYHASGILATKLIDRVSFFEHNCAKDLEQKLIKSRAKRKIVAIEGVYSMSGDIAKREIFEVAKRFDALLIVDEAHSSGTIGKRLLGVFDYYDFEILPNFIKMGTLGKAYGSYGAYILSSKEIKEFLINRAKPIIYSTAPSVFDTALALINFRYILKNSSKLRKKLKKRQELARKILNKDIKSPILVVEAASNKEVILKQQKLLKEGIIVGAIRQPTVEIPINRVILRLGVKKKIIKKALEILNG